LCRFVGFWKAIADGIGRLATMRWSRLRDKESALSDVIRLATVQTKKGFDNRLWLPHAKLLDCQDIHNAISRYSLGQHPAAAG
jgi:hypothetical protein